MTRPEHGVRALLRPPVTASDVEEQARIMREARNPLMRMLFALGNSPKKLLLTILAIITVPAILLVVLEEGFNLLNWLDWLRGLY